MPLIIPARSQSSRHLACTAARSLCLRRQPCVTSEQVTSEELLKPAAPPRAASTLPFPSRSSVSRSSGQQHHYHHHHLLLARTSPSPPRPTFFPSTALLFPLLLFALSSFLLFALLCFPLHLHQLKNTAAVPTSSSASLAVSASLRPCRGPLLFRP